MPSKKPKEPKKKSKKKGVVGRHPFICDCPKCKDKPKKLYSFKEKRVIEYGAENKEIPIAKETPNPEVSKPVQKEVIETPKAKKEKSIDDYIEEIEREKIQKPDSPPQPEVLKNDEQIEEISIQSGVDTSLVGGMPIGLWADVWGSFDDTMNWVMKTKVFKHSQRNRETLAKATKYLLIYLEKEVNPVSMFVLALIVSYVPTAGAYLKEKNDKEIKIVMDKRKEPVKKDEEIIIESDVVDHMKGRDY